MAETLPEGVTRQEFDELRREFRDLIEAQKDLAKARTEEERKEARADVREAKADLDALAKELGISRSALDKATAEARRSEEKERLRPILLELLDEELADDGGEGGAKDNPVADEKPGKRERGSGKPGGKATDDDEATKADQEAGEDKTDGGHGAPDDSAPRAEHWSERSILDYIR